MQNNAQMSVGGDHDRLPPLPTPERIQTLLFDAARLGRSDMVPILVQAGADIDARDSKGHTPLILASYHCHEVAVAQLLELGASIDQADKARGNTALMGVAFKGHAAIARQLLNAGAAPDAVNYAGQTALMLAALFGHIDIVDELLDRGADPHRADVAGNSAISVALSQHNLSMATRLRACERLSV